MKHVQCLAAIYVNFQYLVVYQEEDFPHEHISLFLPTKTVRTECGRIVGSRVKHSSPQSLSKPRKFDILNSERIKMMGSLLSRLLLMVFGYLYPAYECFKTVEKNRPEIDQLVFWCQYWILVAMLTIFERVADFFISWIPLYGEAKLAFFIYLWYPRTRAAAYVYNTLIKPYITKHKEEIDFNLLDLKNKAVMIAIFLCQKASSYGKCKCFEILQYASSQYASRFRSSQQVQDKEK